MLDNTFITITSEMRKTLNLSGNELIVYAVIYGFSQDGESRFAGSRKYLADWCGCTDRQIQNILNDLVERKLITKFEKTIRGVKLCEYVANFTPYEKISPPYEKISLYNIDNNIGKENLSPYGERKEISETESKLYSKEDFIGSAKKKVEPKAKKVSTYDKCIDSINKYTRNVILQNSLIQYLNVRLKMNDKPIYNSGQWEAMLDRLSAISNNTDTRIKIVSQSIEHGWATFYELKTSNSNKKFSEGDGLSCEQNTTTEAERKENLRKRGNISGF